MKLLEEIISTKLILALVLLSGVNISLVEAWPLPIWHIHDAAITGASPDQDGGFL